MIIKILINQIYFNKRLRLNSDHELNLLQSASARNKFNANFKANHVIFATVNLTHKARALQSVVIILTGEGRSLTLYARIIKQC